MAGDNNKILTPLEELLGEKILKRKRSRAGGGDDEIPTSSLATKKQIILYFSAHWCPPCRDFTPLLSKAYDGYKKKVGDEEEESETEVIFVSRDSDAEAFAEYRKEMSFPALPFDADLASRLVKAFGVEGIPSMVAINGKGEAIHENEDSVDFRSLIAAHGADAFPLTPEWLLELKAEEEAKASLKLKDLYNGQIPFMANVGGDASSKNQVSLKELMANSDHVGLLLGDGDASDDCYDAVKDIMKKVNGDKENRCAVVYLGWSLYGNDSDHNKVAATFDYSLSEVSEELRMAIECMIGKGKTGAPLLVLLSGGTGLCIINGKCEDVDVPVVVSTDPGLRKLRTGGAGAFPWDEAAMASFEETKKAKVEMFKSNMTDMRFLTEPGEEGPVLILKDGEQSKLKERLFIGSEEGVVGLYFSAHWCPPCQRFTPKLLECYEELKATGKKFEVVFISSDSSKDEFEKYYKSMVTSAGDQFLALDYEQRDHLKTNLSEVFDVSGIPTLVLLKSDGSLISSAGVHGVNSGGAKSFPWDDATIERVANQERIAALKKEKEDEESQRSLGVSGVVKRLIGTPGSVRHNVSEKTMTFLDYFSTVGAPDLLTNSGVIYYELEVLNDGSSTQFGFAQKDSLEHSDDRATDGVGDNDTSWALDGNRQYKWHGGSELQWPCSWMPGNTIGLAANIDKGMIAVSKDGDWTQDGLGVVFHDVSIKEGVYPCFSASDHQVRYCFNHDGLKYGPPADSVWNVGALFDIKGQNVWLEKEYTLPATISFDAVLNGDHDELISVFSQTKADWGKPECDALTYYLAVDRSDYSFRFNGYLLSHSSTQHRGMVAIPGTSYHFKCTITSTSAEYSIDGQEYATVTYPIGSVPLKGFFGVFGDYCTAGTVKNAVACCG